MGKRIVLWDNLKLFLIFSVVMVHMTTGLSGSSEAFGAITIIINSYVMPGFLFVSGLFSKHSINQQKAPVKKAVGFIVLYFFMRVLISISNIIFGTNEYFDIFSAKDVPWYMMTMAEYYLITWAIKKVDSKYVLICSVVLSCFAGFMSGETDFLTILRAINFYPFFYCGYILDLDTVNKKTSGKGAKIFSAIYIVAVVLISVFVLTGEKVNLTVSFLTCRVKYSHFDDVYHWCPLLRLAWFVCAAAMVFSIISLCPRKELKISKFGSRILQIYVFHRPILYIIRNAGLYALIKQVGAGWEFIAIFIPVIITALLCFKCVGKPIEFLLNPKERDYELTR